MFRTKTVDINVTRGVSLDREYVVYENNDMPIDLTGKTLLAKAKRSTIDNDSLILILNVSVTDAFLGILNLYMTSVFTDSLKEDTYIYEIYIVEPSGNGYETNKTSRIFRGNIYVKDGAS